MIAVPKSSDRLIDVLTDRWTPKQFGPTSDWIKRNVRLSTDFEASPGSYDVDGSPWWREICDAFHATSVDTITILKSTQVGGTLNSLALMLATSVIDPAPGMIVLPTQDEAKITRDRVYANALASDPCLALSVPEERNWNLISIDLKANQVYLAWAGSKQRLRGKPCKWVWLSEIDVYESGGAAGDQTRAAERRTDQFPGSTVIRESTPVGDDSLIANYYDASDERQWWCACPECGRRQVVRFFPYTSGEFVGRGGIVGYTDSKGQDVDPEVAISEAHYLCINGCKIDSSRKSKFMRSGQWLPSGQSFGADGKIEGTPFRSARHRGYHIWMAMNLRKSWGDLAATYIQHRRDGLLRDFFQNVLGLRYRSSASLPAWHKLGKRMAGKHAQGRVPADVWFLTCGCDVQPDRVYYVVRGWAPNRNSWLIDWGEFLRDESEMLEDESQAEIASGLISSDLAQIDSLLEREYPVDGTNPLGRQSLSIRLIGIDANHRTADVHEYVSSRQMDPERGRLRAIRGDHQFKPNEKFRCTNVEKNTRTGEPYEGGLRLWGIKVEHYKQLMYERIRGSRDAAGIFWMPDDMSRIGVKFLRQLVNEPPTQVVEKKSGRKVTVFKPRNKEVGVDYWDCTNYSEALADMVIGDMGWGHTDWEKRWRHNQASGKRRASRASQVPRDYLHT